MRYLILALLLSATQLVTAQDTVRALFLGNSYTHRNSMPTLVDAFAKSTGDRAIIEDNTPGGFTLGEHSTNPVSTQLIQKRSWDFVVLQEQSQLPSFPEMDVQQWVYPAASTLSSMIKANDSCTEVVFYRTWGRKNGDARNCPTWPPVCSYKGMDSLLALRYQTMADQNEALVSPVGEVWKKIRAQYPNIELYAPDESHPSAEGSYAAACCFYTLFFRKDPTLNSYKYSLSDSTAARIKRITKQVLFNDFDRWNIGKRDPKAGFEVLSSVEGLVSFQSKAAFVDRIKWDFGNGDTGFATDTAYQYDSSGSYSVKMIAIGCGRRDTMTQNVKVEISTVGVLPKTLNSQVHFQGSVMQVSLDASFNLRILDMSGRTLHNGYYQQGAGIALEKLPHLYIVEVRSKGQVVRLLQAKP